MNEGHRLRGKEARVAYIVIDNAVKHLLFVVTWEGRLKEKHKPDATEDSVPSVVIVPQWDLRGFSFCMNLNISSLS